MCILLGLRGPLHQQVFGLKDVFIGGKPFIGAHAVNAAANLGDALNEQQKTGDNDYGLELVDWNARRAVD